MFNHTISAILRGQWLIDKGFADAHLPLVFGLITGQTATSGYLKGNGDFEQPFVIGPNMKRTNVIDFRTGQLKTDAIGPGSVFVMPFTGPIMKYDGMCGEYGNVKRTSWIQEMQGHPNIIGYASILDTPGGQADGTPQMADLIRSLDIPTVGIVSGGAYSAGAWIGSGHNQLYAADNHSGFGSIGAYTSIVDYRGYFDKQGYKVQSIYPEESKDKNSAYRKAIDGDVSEAKQNIAELARGFISSFEVNRKDRLTSDEWKTGKTYNTTESIRIGLVDGVKSLADAVKEMQGSKIYAPGASASKKSDHNMNFKNVTALAGVENATAEQLDLANGDLTGAGVTGYTLVPESLITEAADITAQRDQLQEQVTSLTAERDAANKSLGTAQADLATAQARIAELGKGPGASHNREAGDDTPADEDEIDSIMDSLPHNRRADSLL